MNDKVGAIMEARETSETCVSVRLEYGLYCRSFELIYRHHLSWSIRKEGNKGVLCGVTKCKDSGAVWWQYG